jgi:hypothetical protein
MLDSFEEAAWDKIQNECERAEALRFAFTAFEDTLEAKELRDVASRKPPLPEEIRVTGFIPQPYAVSPPHPEVVRAAALEKSAKHMFKQSERQLKDQIKKWPD